MRQWEMYAEFVDSKTVEPYYHHFHSDPNFIKYYYGKDPKHVLLVESHLGPYYGWIRKKNIAGELIVPVPSPVMIQRGWNRFSTQFTNGVEAEQFSGKGIHVRATVKECE